MAETPMLPHDEWQPDIADSITMETWWTAPAPDGPEVMVAALNRLASFPGDPTRWARRTLSVLAYIGAVNARLQAGGAAAPGRSARVALLQLAARHEQGDPAAEAELHALRVTGAAVYLRLGRCPP